MSFVVVLDVGSSSVKGALYDERARLVPATLAREASPIRARPDGATEGDAVALVRRVERVVDRVMAAAGKRAAGVRAVGLDVLTITLCGVGDSGRPHLGHARASGAAHSSQNFAPASFSCWHRGHLIGRTSLWRSLLLC